MTDFLQSLLRNERTMWVVLVICGYIVGWLRGRGV